MKKKSATICKGLIFSFLAVVFLVNTCGMVSHAEGLLPETLVNGSTLLYERYSMSNYNLDFMVIDGNLFEIWGDVKDAPVNTILFALTGFLWNLSRVISQVGSYLIGQAYEFDLLSNAIDGLSENMKTMFGITESGFTTAGFLPQLLIFTILFLGGYAVFMGMFRREFTKVYRAVINYVVVFAISVTFILGSGTYVKTLNDVSNSVSASVLDVGKNLVSLSNGSGTLTGSGDSVENIREMLFLVQVRNPWLVLEFGTADEEAIGKERINAIESQNHLTKESSKERMEAVKKEIKDMENTNMTSSGVLDRLVSTVIFLILNIIITFFVSFMAIIMLLSQLLFLFFAMFLPINFLIGLLPMKQHIVYRGLMRVFGYMCLKVGISFVLMIAFSLSMFCYNISAGVPLLFSMVLQIICFFGVYRSLGSITEMLGIGDSMKESVQKQSEVKHGVRNIITKTKNIKRTVGGVAVRGAVAYLTGGQSETTGVGQMVTSSVSNMNNRKLQKNEQKTEREQSRSDVYSGNSSGGTISRNMGSEVQKQRFEKKNQTVVQQVPTVKKENMGSREVEKSTVIRSDASKVVGRMDKKTVQGETRVNKEMNEVNRKVSEERVEKKRNEVRTRSGQNSVKVNDSRVSSVAKRQETEGYRQLMPEKERKTASERLDSLRNRVKK